MRRSLAALSLVAVISPGLLAACGGSSKHSSSSTAASSASAASGGSAAQASGGSDSAFCKDAVNARDENQKFASLLAGGNPDAVKKAVEETNALLPVLQRDAPSSIKAAVDEIVKDDQALAKALQDDGYSYTKIPPSVAQQFQTKAAQDATTKLEDYLQNVCKISLTPPTTA